MPPVARAVDLNARVDAGRRSEVYAALDLGTNNCRLLIARPQFAQGAANGFAVIDAFSRIVRLDLTYDGAPPDSPPSVIYKTSHPDRVAAGKKIEEFAL